MWEKSYLAVKPSECIRLRQFALLCLYLFCSLEGEHAAELLRVTGHRHTIDQHLLSSEPAHLRQDLLFVPDHTVKINIRKKSFICSPASEVFLSLIYVWQHVLARVMIPFLLTEIIPWKE